MTLRLLVLLLLALALTAARAGEVQVAVAANFAGPMARIAEGFAAASGHRVQITTGASGRFLAQIVAGAPFDVLLAADDTTPAKLISLGHAVADTAFTYATGRLVLWSPRPGFVDAQGAVLGQGGYTHLAIANPKLAPYGRAALEVLKARGLAESLAGRVVTGESIAQAYQFVATGNAQLGFVALSQVAPPGQPMVGSAWRVPQALYGPIRQDAVLLKNGAANPAARALLAWLHGAAARAIILDYGYGL